MKKFALVFAISLTAWVSFRCADYSSQPPASPDLMVVNTTDTSVTVQWTGADVEVFHSYILYLSRRSAIDTASDSAADTIRYHLDTRHILYGLQPETRYFVRVLVKAINDEMAWSNEVEFVTKGDLKSLVLFDPESDSLVDTIVHLAWTAWQPADFRQYTLYYDTTEKVDTADRPAWTRSYTRRDDTTAAVSLPHRGKKYWFRLHLQDTRRAIAASSNTVSFTADSGIPDPVQMRIDTVADTFAVVSWTRSTERQFAAYVVYRDTTPKIDTFHRIDTVFHRNRITTIRDQSRTGTVISPLRRSTRYYFTVYVMAGSGLVRACPIDSGRTGSGLLDPVRVSLSDATDTTATLRWTESTQPGFGGYIVLRDTVSTAGRTGRAVDTITQRDSISYTVRALRPSTQYWFSIAVLGANGLSNPGNAVANFPVILSYDTADDTDSTVSLSWTQKAGNFGSYRLVRDTTPDVQDKPATRLMTSEQRNATDFVDTTLVAGKEYYYRVYVYEVDSLGTPLVGRSNEVIVRR